MSETHPETNFMITGMVKRVMTLLSAVSVTDNATSPFASIEKTFEELPPGQHAISTSPIKYTGGRFRIQATRKAIVGSTTSCPSMPNSTALGFLAISVKAFLFKSIPNRNINTIRIGITIHIVFIDSQIFAAANLPIFDRNPISLMDIEYFIRYSR
jgi:hypothetical protein